MQYPADYRILYLEDFSNVILKDSEFFKSSKKLQNIFHKKHNFQKYS